MAGDGPDNEGMDPGALVIVGVLFEGGLAPLSLVLGWLLGQPPLSGFAWSARDAGFGVLATLPMLGLLGLAVRWPAGPLRKVKRFFDEELRPLLRSRPWSDLALIAVAAGVGEEMLFRGVIQGSLSRHLGPGWGLATASLIFGVLHPITPGYIVLAGLLGAYLGGVWLLTGNLLAVMVAHGLYDFLALLVLLRSEDSPAA